MLSANVLEEIIPVPHRAWDDPDSMIGVDEVLDRVLASVNALPISHVEILEARGMTLAEDVQAASDVPPFTNSAMDGFALSSVATDDRQPASFELVGTIPAGSERTPEVGPGQAARIMTGAPLPDGADAVIRFEEVDDHESGFVTVQRAVHPGENVRLAGEDVRTGEVVLRRGQQLGTAEIGMLAALNVGTVAVHRRPKVAIISTGDEVVDIGPELRPGQIRDANAYMLAAAAAELGAEPVRLGIAADSRDDLQERFRAAGDCDMIVTSGGVSHGDFDLVKDVLRQEGRIDIWTVRIKPGKPLAFGMLGETPLLGLPGNPAAAAVSFDQFGRPAILKMVGVRNYRIPTVTARLTETVENRGRRRHFERGQLELTDGEWQVRTTGIHGSAMLSSLTAANCYVVIPEDCPVATAGSMVEVQVLAFPTVADTSEQSTSPPGLC